MIIDELNIENHTKALILKALCSSKTVREAALKLGIHERTLNSHIEKYKIQFKYAVWEIKEEK